VADHVGVVIGSTTRQQALQEHRILQFHQQDLLDRLAQLRQQAIESDGLGEVAGEPIQKPATVMALQPMSHDGKHQGIADQFTTGHDSLRLLTQGRGRFDLGAEKIACGEME
jgi:hypothetical protein